jgi:hypothetical protein
MVGVLMFLAVTASAANYNFSFGTMGENDLARDPNGAALFAQTVPTGGTTMIISTNSNTFEISGTAYRLCVKVGAIIDTITFSDSWAQSVQNLQRLINAAKVPDLFAASAVSKEVNGDTHNAHLVLYSLTHKIQILPCSTGSETVIGLDYDIHNPVKAPSTISSDKLLIEDFEDSTPWASDATTSATCTIGETTNHMWGAKAIVVKKGFVFVETAAYGTATANNSSTQSNTPIKAIDRDLTTYWQSTINTGWLRVTLGDSGFIFKAAVTFRSGKAATGFRIQYSDDGWNDLKTITGNTDVAWTTTFDSGIYANDWRVYIDTPATGDSASVAEFYLYCTTTFTTQYALMERSLDSVDISDYCHGDLRIDGNFIQNANYINYAFLRLGTSASHYQEWRLQGLEIIENAPVSWTAKLNEPTFVLGNGWNSADIDYMAVGFRMVDTFTPAVMIIDQAELYAKTATEQADEKIGKKVIIKLAIPYTYSDSTRMTVAAESVTFTGNAWAIEITVTGTAGDSVLVGVAGLNTRRLYTGESWFVPIPIGRAIINPVVRIGTSVDLWTTGRIVRTNCYY